MPREGCDLSKTLLTRAQRLWLAQVVIEGRFTIRELSDKWNLKYRRVHKYAYHLKHGRIPTDGAGRPKVLDEQGIAQIRSSIIDSGIRDRTILKADLDDAYTLSYKRRRLGIEDVDDIELEMKERTRNQYIFNILRENDNQLI